MQLKVLSSSSKGNLYLLYNNTEVLVLEAGLPFIEVKKSLDFNISNIKGLCLSHAHGDHSKYVKQYLDAGIIVLSGKETFESLNLLDNYNAKPVVPDSGYKVGNFKIIPLNAFHDVPCLGFLISHPESGSIAFFTDTYLIEYNLSGVSHIMVESNYSDEILEDRIIHNKTHPSMRPRLLQTHMSLSTVLGILKSTDLSSLNDIVLLHLSDGNSDQDRFVREVRELTGKQVYIAEKGLSIDFNSDPY